MAPKKDKPSLALETEAKAPKEGTKGVIWGQQVKKPKNTGWTDKLEWNDASPANVDEFLMGAEEGGFMGLEEVDGEVFDKIVKGTANETPKDSKKRKGVVGAATDKSSKKKNAEREAELRSGKTVRASGKKVKGVAVAEKKEPANKKAKVEAAAGKVEVDGKAGAAAPKGKGKEKKAGPMEKVVMAASKEGVAGTSDNIADNNVVMLTLESKEPKVKAPKMTSSEIKRRKKEKRRERKSEQEAARREKLEPSAISGFFRGPEAKAEEIEQAEGAEKADEDQGDEVVAADSEAEANGHAVEESAGQVPDVKKLSKKERAKLRAKEENERRAALGAGGVREHAAGKAGTIELRAKKTGGIREQNGSSLLATAQAPASASAQPSVGREVTLEAKTKAGEASKKRKAPETGASEGAKELEGPVLEEDADEEVERRASGEAAGPAECDVSAWEEFGLHPLLLKGLAKLGFAQPTEIQKQCIPAALQQGKDLVGAAETGSGKTLAFGLPILHRLLQIEDKEKKTAETERAMRGAKDSSAGGRKKGASPLRALIMTPTRELALQVCSHLKAAAQETSIRVVAIVGGMAVPKQQRLLRARPAIVVGTPGRLWELISQGEQHLLQVDDLRFFVLDEADRMVEKGHFKELQSIIDTLPKQGGSAPAESDPPEEDDDDDAPVAKHAAQRQTFVFSATLMVPPSLKKKLKGAGKVPMRREQGQVAALIERAGLSRRAAIIDLTSDSIVAAKLEEAVVECLETEKDAYLYYLLRLHPSRTIVFCTAISAVRRIAALLQLLQVPSWALHAQMQQRQRFKAMDRFKKEEHGVLVATDVAARGLDIEGIRCVIHYQLPLSTEIYVHRSGRTARAATDGISVALISPPERPKLNALCKALGKEEGLAPFPINQAYMPAVLERVKMAIKVDSSLRQQQQTKAKRSWLEKHAEELGIELDADELEEQSRTSKKGKVRVENDKVPAPADAKALEAKLRSLVKQPLQPRAMHHTYLAGSGLSAETVKQLQQSVKRKGGPGAGAIGTPGEEALDALRSKRVKK